MNKVLPKKFKISEVIKMIHLSLTEQEVSVLKMSINHCLETCNQGGARNSCPDCETLREVAGKIGVNPLRQ